MLEVQLQFCSGADQSTAGILLSIVLLNGIYIAQKSSPLKLLWSYSEHSCNHSSL